MYLSVTGFGPEQGDIVRCLDPHFIHDVGEYVRVCLLGRDKREPCIRCDSRSRPVVRHCKLVVPNRIGRVCPASIISKYQHIGHTRTTRRPYVSRNVGLNGCVVLVTSAGGHRYIIAAQRIKSVACLARRNRTGPAVRNREAVVTTPIGRPRSATIVRRH